MHPIPALDYLNFPSNGIYSNLAIQVNQCFYSMLQRCNDPCPPSSTNPIYELFQGYMRSPVKIDLVGLTIATDFGTLSSLIIVAILSTVSGMAVPLYRNYQIRNGLSVATEQVIQGLGRARMLSQAAQDDSGWGFYVPAGILYKGESYAARDSNYDEVYPMPMPISPLHLF